MLFPVYPSLNGGSGRTDRTDHWRHCDACWRLFAQLFQLISAAAVDGPQTPTKSPTAAVSLAPGLSVSLPLLAPFEASGQKWFLQLSEKFLQAALVAIFLAHGVFLMTSFWLHILTNDSRQRQIQAVRKREVDGDWNRDGNTHMENYNLVNNFLGLFCYLSVSESMWVYEWVVCVFCRKIEA